MLENLEREYSPGEKFPLGWYALTTLAFNTLLFGIILRRHRRGRRENTPLEMRELLLMGAATHKLARVITKDEVTSFIRAPFTRYQESLGYGELNEAPRRSGGLQVVGELLTCNYCMSAWVGLGFFWGFSRFPRQTRSVAGFFSALAIADFMHVAYEERRTQANVLTLREEKMDREKERAA